MQFKGAPEKSEFLGNLAKDVYKTREEQMGQDLARQVERFVMLSVVDNLWIDHLDAVENLRQGMDLGVMDKEIHWLSIKTKHLLCLRSSSAQLMMR